MTWNNSADRRFRMVERYAGGRVDGGQITRFCEPLASGRMTLAGACAEGLAHGLIVRRRRSLLAAPSALGHLPEHLGVERAPEVLLGGGLADGLAARRAGRVEESATAQTVTPGRS